MLITVCGGPTAQVSSAILDRAGVKSTVWMLQDGRLSNVVTIVDMDRTLLVGTTLPSKGTDNEYFAPSDGSAPSNSISTTVGELGGGVLPPSLQATEVTVWGGPTTHVPGGPSTSAGGTSTMSRVQNCPTSKADVMLEMLKTLLVATELPSSGTVRV